MNPGRELDILIAEKVMGFKIENGSAGQLLEITNAQPRHVRDLLHYSTDIASAWDVVEKLKANTSLWSDGFTLVFDTEEKKWRAGALWWRSYEGAHWWDSCSAMADTAPHAICLAALRALDPLK